MSAARYRIRRLPNSPYYGLWDTHEHRWVNKYGEPDEDYAAINRGVAVMRRRDLNLRLVMWPTEASP